MIQSSVTLLLLLFLHILKLPLWCVAFYGFYKCRVIFFFTTLVIIQNSSITLNFMLPLCSARCFIVQRKEASTREHSNGPVLNLAWDGDSQSSSSIIFFSLGLVGRAYAMESNVGVGFMWLEWEWRKDMSPNMAKGRASIEHIAEFYLPLRGQHSLGTGKLVYRLLSLRPLQLTLRQDWEVVKGLASFLVY